MRPTSISVSAEKSVGGAEGSRTEGAPHWQTPAWAGGHGHLLAKGHAYKEIADYMKISFETVRTHVRSIYDKLHVHSRTEATLKYLGK